MMNTSPTVLKRLCFGFFTVFACIVVLLHSNSFAQAPPYEQQCGQNVIGDMICPPSVNAYTMSDSGTFNFSNILSGADVFGSGSQLFSMFGSSTGSISIRFDDLESLFDTLPQVLGNVLISKAFEMLDGGDSGDLASLITSFTQLQLGLDGLQGMNCGGSNINGDFLSYAHNAVALLAGQSSGASFDPTSILSSVCSNISGGSTSVGPGGRVPIDAAGEGGERIADCARQMIGQSTADNPLTEGGSLGCALAVSRILDCAGYGVGTHVSTVALYNALDADPCYQIVDTGEVTSQDAMGLQPGDVLVTQRGERAGHTGIYVGNGNIVSNSSGGFNGSARGTIQQNYTVTQWKSVTDRNIGGSAVFRRVACPPT